MTATELRDKLHNSIADSSATVQEMITITNLLHEYEEQLCREQREICALALTGTAVLEIDNVIDAPMPEI